jgi:prepilin-type N-terminal cleavage/methylation domain-containing protein
MNPLVQTVCISARDSLISARDSLNSVRDSLKRASQDGISKPSQCGYTLVELIVVIAILVILSTVGFVGYSQYTASSRDGARISDMRAIYQAIGVSVSQKGIAPAPDTPVSIYSSAGVVLSLQGSIGEGVRQTIGLETGGRDPLDEVGYTYLRFKDKKSIQLLGLFESEGWGPRIATNILFTPEAYAATDYTERHPAAYGKKL